MRSLIDGIKRYETAARPQYTSKFAALATGQKPLAMFISCADSRVVPNLVASADPGELFVVRNVANLVPPKPANERTAAEDTSVSAAVWYALEVLDIHDLIVCGHSGCGGMKAVLTPEAAPAALERWLAPASGAVERWRQRGALDPSLTPVDQLSQQSTLSQLENLLTHDHVRARVESGDVRLHAWWFDIPTGRLLAYSEEAGRYVPAVEALSSAPSASAAE